MKGRFFDLKYKGIKAFNLISSTNVRGRWRIDGESIELYTSNITLIAIKIEGEPYCYLVDGKFQNI